jgi:hypothetical protein
MLGTRGLPAQDPEEARKLAAWAKGHIIPGQDEAIWRSDAFGSVMRYHDYGDRSSEHGWEIDHYPIPRGFDGLDTMPNARPLHWRNHASHRGALRRVAGIRATTAGRRATGP